MINRPGTALQECRGWISKKPKILFFFLLHLLSACLDAAVRASFRMPPRIPLRWHGART